MSLLCRGKGPTLKRSHGDLDVTHEQEAFMSSPRVPHTHRGLGITDIGCVVCVLLDVHHRHAMGYKNEHLSNVI